MFESAEIRYDFLSGTLLKCRSNDWNELIIVADGDLNARYSLVILLQWRDSDRVFKSFLIRELGLMSYAMAMLESVLHEP